MIERDDFGPFLRRERERRGITLQDIAGQTKIAASLFAALERNDFSRWPGGIYRRSFVRAYAEAVGLDAERTLGELTRLFPDDEEEPAEAQSKPRSTGARMAVASAEFATVAIVSVVIGVSIGWFYAWPVLVSGAIVVTALNLPARKKGAAPSLAETRDQTPVAPTPPVTPPRHATKRRGAEPRDTGRRHRPRRPARRARP